MSLMTMKSPGVEVNEYDLTSYILPESSSVGAVVGQFDWGPVNEIQTISNEDILTAQYGKPSKSVYMDWFSVKNFLEYTNNCKVLRVVDETAVTGALNAIANSTKTAIRINNEEDYTTNFSSGQGDVGIAIAKYPGSIGNSLRLEIADSHTFSGLDQQTIEITNAGTGYVTLSDNGAAVTFSPPTSGGSAATGTLVVASDVVTGITITDSGTGYKTFDTVTVTIPAPTGGGTRATATIGLWKYRNQFLTDPGTSQSASSLGSSNDQLHMIVIDEDGLFTGQGDTVVGRYPFVSKMEGAKAEDGTSIYYKDVLNTQSKYLYWMDHPSGTNWGAVTSATVFTNSVTLTQYSFSKGQNGADITNDEKFTGWDRFKNKETVDVALLISGNADNILKQYIIEIAEHREDCIAFLSPNFADVVNNYGDELEDCVTTRNILSSSSYSVMDCNWKYQFDVHNDTFRWLPCNADVAGLCARTEEDRDAWWSPAGYRRGHINNVVKFAWNPDLTDRDELYSTGINPVLRFAGEGSMLFGDKTMLTEPSAFDRIGVRRLFIVLEKSIARSAKYLLFEFNDTATRLLFTSMVDPFLRRVQGARGIIDYAVVCNNTNNTPQIIANNGFVADIYIKPNRSINYISLSFIATPTGISFSKAVQMYMGATE